MRLHRSLFVVYCAFAYKCVYTLVNMPCKVGNFPANSHFRPCIPSSFPVISQSSGGTADRRFAGFTRRGGVSTPRIGVAGMHGGGPAAPPQKDSGEIERGTGGAIKIQAPDWYG